MRRHSFQTLAQTGGVEVVRVAEEEKAVYKLSVEALCFLFVTLSRSLIRSSSYLFQSNPIFKMVFIKNIQALVPLVLAQVLVSNAHLSVWMTSMYGLDPTNPNSINASQPLQDLKFDDWYYDLRSSTLPGKC